MTSILSWEDVDGYVLTERAINNGFTYIYYWGTSSNRYYVDIYEGEKEYKDLNPRTLVDCRVSGDRNFGKRIVKQHAEDHAKDNKPSWFSKLKGIFK